MYHQTPFKYHMVTDNVFYYIFKHTHGTIKEEDGILSHELEIISELFIGGARVENF